MSDVENTSREQLHLLEERNQKLGREKSYLQLIINLMNKVSAVEGLDNVIGALLGNILDVIGGTNITLYYRVNGELLSADLFGRHLQLDRIDDEIVRRTFEFCEPQESVQDFRDTQMLCPEFTHAYTWAVPLVAGGDLVGVLKLENLHIAMRELYAHLPTFFTYVASVLKNEILGQARLKQECAHSRFLENLDSVSRSIQGMNDLQQMMHDVLDTVLSIFDCDRASLLFPCDPGAESWRALMERTRPEYPGLGTQDLEVPVDPDAVRVFQALLDSGGPVSFGPESGQALPADMSTRFGIRSQLAMALYPKVGRPWMFVVHQCSRPRVWMPDEVSLFQEIGRRVSDGLTSLLMLRDLTASEEKYRTLIQKIRAAVVVHGADTRILTSNSMAQELLGLTEEQLLGKTVLDPAWHFVREDGTSMPPEEYPASRVLATRQALRNCVVGVIRPVEGRPNVVWVLADADPVFGQEERISQIIVTFVDITKRRKAESELARANRALRMLSTSNETLLHVSDEATLLNEVCRIAIDVGGYRMAWVGFAEEDAPKTLRPVACAGYDSGYIESAHLTWSEEDSRGRGPSGQAIRTGQPSMVRDIPGDPAFAPWREEALLRGYQAILVLPLTCDGRTFGALGIYSGEADAFDEGEVRILKEMAGDLAFGLTALRTRARRERAEKALQERETFIRKILETVDDGFIVVDREYRIQSANKAYCASVGLDEEQVLGRHCYEVSHHAARPCFEAGENCAARQTFDTGMPALASHRHGKASGASQFMEVKTYPICDASGTVTSVIETLRDVTETKALEEQLRHAQRMEAIGRLAGGVAHDFNNILTAIVGYGTLARMKVHADDPLRATLDQILASSERAARLTQSLLAFSRKQVFTLKPVDLHTVIRGFEKLLRRLIGEDVELSVQLAGGDLVILADAGQIEQVLMNLATNARDAMPRGGTLTIATQLTDLDEVTRRRLGLVRPGRYAMVTVSDSGCGMDEKTRERLFEPFFTTKEPGQGTGLGLAIVYGIVKQHGGDISVATEPGKGTTFRIHLPLTSTSVEMSPVLPEERPRRGTETILLAEDDPDVRTLTRSVLQDFGYRVIEAADGQEAIDRFRERASEIGLLLLDVIMPKRSGRDVCEAARAIRPGVKVLYSSGYAADLVQRAGVFEEGVQFLPKPASPVLLLRRVREVLDATS